MTSKVLTKAVIHNAKHNIKQSKKISLIILVLHLLAMPAVLINTVFNYMSGLSDEPDDIIAFVAAGTTFIAGVAGIIIAFMNFRYLYNKSQVDMCLSQPMTKLQRFVSDYVSGLISYIAPFFAAEAVSAVMLLICHLTMDGKTFLLYRSSGYATNLVCNIFETMAPYFFKLFIIGILMMIMLYTLTVLIAACCGSLFESVMYTIFANGAIPAALLFILHGYFDNINGVDLQKFFIPLISCTSPAGGIVKIAYYFSYNETSLGFYPGMKFPLWIAGYIFTTLIMLAGAYLLYIKRKAEDVSKPFVFKGLYYITITFITFCICALFRAASVKHTVAMLITSFVVYMILEIISKRGFKRIWTGIIRYAATIAVCAGFGAICKATDYFGIESRVPAASAVSSVHICYDGIYRGHNFFGNTFNYYEGSEREKDILMTCELTSPENINAVISAHKSIVENYKAKQPESNSRACIAICYMMKNGGKLVRTYYGIPISAAEALSAVDTSEEYKAQYADYIKELCYDSYDAQLKRRSGEKDKRPQIDIFSERPFDYDRGKALQNNFAPDREFFTRLGDALAADIKDLTPEQILRPSSAAGYRLSILSSRGEKPKTFSVSVSKDHRRTLALLYEYNFIVNYDYENFEMVLAEFAQEPIRIYSPDDYSNGLTSDIFYSEAAPMGRLHAKGKFIIHSGIADEELLMDVMKEMRGMYITDVPCYTILVGSELYIVPPSQSAAAEKLYSTYSTAVSEGGKEYSYDGELYPPLANNVYDKGI